MRRPWPALQQRTEGVIVRKCPHRRIVPVESIIDPDEILAGLCLDCGDQLPADQGKAARRAGDGDLWDTLQAQLSYFDECIDAALKGGAPTTYSRSLREQRLAVWMQLKAIADRMGDT